MQGNAQTLEQVALEAGFDAAGWASAEVPRAAIVDYERWLALGRHAGMDYLPRQLGRKSDLSPFSSVLVLGISHAFEAPAPPPGGTRVGRVAKYAWTPDYHAQLEPRLNRIVQEAQKLGLNARAYVDHGPVLERMLAARAFIGWRARSGMIVSQSLGAFLTLAVVLTDLKLEPEGEKANRPPLFPSPLPLLPSSSPEHHPDRCGRCTRCVSSCPTGAIQNDRTIDARVCISYLTIEHRGPVALELRPSIGHWLFGCDVCLEVCPWSGKAGQIARQWQPDPELVYPDLEPFFTLSSRQFEKRYAHTAFSRARRKGMARNACTVLGNTQDPRYLGLLGRAAHDEAWEVREAAAWALSRLEGGGHRLEALRADPDERVRQRVNWALEQAG